MGCVTVRDVINQTNQTLYITCGEDASFTRTIPPFAVGSLGGHCLPWAVNGDEIRNKAFKFYLGGAPTYYIYQVFGRTDTSAWARYVFAATPTWGAPILLGNVAEIDIEIPQPPQVPTASSV